MEQDANQIVRIGNVIANFPESMIEIAEYYDENSNDEGIGVTHTLTKWGEWKKRTKYSANMSTGFVRYLNS